MFTKIYEGTKNFIIDNYKFLLLIVGINLLFWVELPYVVETPGGSILLNERVEVENGYDYDGQLGMAYVSVVRGSIPYLLASLFIPNWDIVEKDDMLYDNESMADMLRRDKLYLQEAIDNATISALEHAGKDVKITKEYVNVAYIDPKAKTDLQTGDLILNVEDKKISSMNELREIIESKAAGEVITFKIERDGKKKEATATAYETDDGIKAGISAIITYDYDSEVNVDVAFKSSESGPSGGLMTALAIYNSLVEEDITKGRYIIGTGTIDKDGNVGEIGGVKYKIIGAAKKDADIFLCPMENLEEALEVKKENDLNIEIKGVKTLEEAINYLLG